MESPFVNDPFAMVWQAFKNLYPGKDCEVQWPSSRSMAELLRKCSENRSQKNEICTYRK